MADERLEIAIKAVNEASKALKDVQNDLGGLDNAAKKSSGGFGELGNAAKIAALGGIAILGAGLKASVDAALEAEQVMAKTNAVLKSTGGIAGVTAKDVTELADRLSQMAGVDDELIQSAENVLLTFTAIGKDVFPSAMEAALNMSVALGTDLQGAVIQVGKALQDPIKGVTALRRVGVNFNADAMKMIKTMVAMGDTAGAQAFILKELETEFGGVAKAAGDTTKGALDKAGVALENLGEKIGGKVLPALGRLAEGFTRILDPADTATKRLEEINSVLEEQTTLQPHIRRGLEEQRDGLVELAHQEQLATLAAQEELEIKKHVIDAVRSQRDANLELIPSEEELAEQAEIAAKEFEKQAEAMRKARDASADAAEGFFGLAQAYSDGVTKLELVKRAFEAIDTAQRSGILTDAERRQAQESLLLQFGLVTERALEQARAEDELTRLFQIGKVTVDEYTAGLLTIPGAARDGVITMDELGEGVGRASQSMNDAAQQAEQLRDRIGSLESREIVVRTIYENITRNIIQTAGRIGGRQLGGPLGAGELAIVGETGPELFASRAGGTVISNADFRRVIGALESLAGNLGGGVNVNVNAGRLSDAFSIEQARRARVVRQTRTQL